jgi:hypothetical protein
VNMRRVVVLILCAACGCSTAPVADLMDHFCPGRLTTNGPFYGGVSAPHGVPPGPPVVVAPPAAPVPEPAPLPPLPPPPDAAGEPSPLPPL